MDRDRFLVARIVVDGLTLEVTAVLPPPPPAPRRIVRKYVVDGCEVYSLESIRRAA